MIPTPLSPAQLLYQLQERITTEIKDAWLFPQRRAVSGFLGTGPIVIVGWRPSPSAFPDDRALHQEILWRELEIISAPYAVAPMGDAYDRVAALLMTRGVKPIARLPQYASMNYGPDRVATFRSAVADLAAVARRNRWIP